MFGNLFRRQPETTVPLSDPPGPDDDGDDGRADALLQALVDSHRGREANADVYRHNMAALLLSYGGSVVVPSEVLAALEVGEYAIKQEPADGGVRVYLEEAGDDGEGDDD